MRERGFYNSRRYDLDTPATYVYTLLLCLACWLVGYIYSIGYPVYSEATALPLWNYLCQVMPGKAFTYIIGILLMLGGAFLLHRANYALMLIREKTLLPFLLFVLFLSTNPDFFPLKSTSAGVFCLILAIYQLLSSYHDPEAKENAYKAALFIGIGSLLWIHILWFLPLFWLGMFNFRSLSPRTFIASLLGISTVYWFLLGWCVWQGDFSPFGVSLNTLFKIRLMQVNGTNFIDWIGTGYIALLVILSSINILTHEYEDSLRTRQYLFFLILMAVWSFGLYFLYEQSSEEFLEISCIPASILIAHFFTVKRGKKVFWLYHLTVAFILIHLIARLWNSL